MSLLQDRLKAVNDANSNPSVENKKTLDSYNNKESNVVIDNKVDSFKSVINSMDEEDDILNTIKSKQRREYDNPQQFLSSASPQKKPTEENVNLSSSEELSEEMLEAYEIKKIREYKEKERKELLFSKIINAILVAACIYLIFLIYGVAVTNYSYDETGNIIPQVMSVSDIKECKEFEKILIQYENCRLLYENVLMLDYRLGQGIEDPLIIAPEYEALLENVEKVIVQIEALDTEVRYEQIKNMLLTWVSSDMAIYLQKMSSAISQNNSEDATIALTYQNITYNDFSLISENIVSMGSQINGIDIVDIKNWSPENYINEKINKNK